MSLLHNYTPLIKFNGVYIPFNTEKKNKTSQLPYINLIKIL